MSPRQDLSLASGARRSLPRAQQIETALRKYMDAAGPGQWSGMAEHDRPPDAISVPHYPPMLPGNLQPLVKISGPT